MLYFQIVLDIVLVTAVGYLYYPKYVEFYKKELQEIRTVTAKRSNPVCPTCKNELVGQVYRSISGHWCCYNCFVTIYGNK